MAKDQVLKYINLSDEEQMHTSIPITDGDKVDSVCMSREKYSLDGVEVCLMDLPL